MKKIINRIDKKKYLPLIIYLLITFLITIPMLTPTLNVDAYCNIYGGYLGTARHFMKSGRVFTALSFFLANYAKISFTNFSLISVVLSNIFISPKEFDTYNNEQLVFDGDTLYLLIF